MRPRRRAAFAATQTSRHHGIVRRAVHATTIGLAALLALACAQAAPPPAPAVPTPLRVGLSFDYPPFSSGDPESPSGLDVEIARAFAASVGREVVFVRTRWPELTSDLVAGRFDLALGGVTVRPDRSLAGRFSAPLVESGAVLLTPVHSTLHDLDAVGRAGVRIAVNAGGHLERVARARFPRAQILRITPNDAVPVAIEAGKADAVLTDTLEAPHWQAKHPGLRRIGPLTQDRKAALVRAGDTATARALDDWLLRREADGALGQWRRAHLGQAAGGETATPLGALVAALDERLALMPDVARAKRLRGLPITDAAQEARVLDAASQAVNDAAAALHRPAPPDTAVRAFFEAQMALARALQEHPTHAAPAADEANGHAPPDLDLTLRPAIARISDRISVGLVALPPEVDAARAASALRTGIRSVTLDAAEIEAMARSIADCARR